MRHPIAADRDCNVVKVIPDGVVVPNDLRGPSSLGENPELEQIVALVKVSDRPAGLGSKGRSGFVPGSGRGRIDG